ncbi:hypothetical protein TD95_003028 [Thielaviopsis punctulata]|uniref:Uncharacterized protein n=1 Tax=Thielaviopsis punctulata TaxID=72032 RepID=A0A0F4ZEJ4_9PEZI|nr:hypothetical protein TD95_003028 [Thielaviopsis punctulata]
MSALPTENSVSASTTSYFTWPNANFSVWSASNVKAGVHFSHYAPSLEDLVLVVPRIAKKLGALILSGEDNILITSRPFSDADKAASIVIKASSFSAAMASTVADDVTAGAGAIASDSSAPVTRMTPDSLRSLGSILSFVFSKWAISSIAMTIILNRTNVYARTRRRIRLSLLSRLLLRFPPIGLLLYYSFRLLQAIQCQTSPDFAQLRWNDPAQSSDLMFAFHLPFLNRLSSFLLLGASDQGSCLAVGMIPFVYDDTPPKLKGSLSLLWPVFLGVCLSWFVECLTCAVEGRHTSTETGMSLLETSLAFSEAEGVISSHIKWDILGHAKPSASGSSSLVLTRAMILSRVNTPPEMLLVALLTCAGHISSNLLGIFNLQSRYRLLNTGIWATCFMAALISSWLQFSFDEVDSQSLLRFPTVCLISWVPHMMLFFGMVCCFLIYSITVLLSSLSMREQGPNTTVRSNIAAAMNNMQARISLAELRVTGQIDFYTALLRIGFAAVSLASEAVYLQEDRHVSVAPCTWLEKKRIEELNSTITVLGRMNTADLRYDGVGTVGLIPIERDADDSLPARNGYASQRLSQTVKDLSYPEKRSRDGIGASERRNKLLMAIDLVLSMGRLVLAVYSICTLAVLRALGFSWKPQLLLRFSKGMETGQAKVSSHKNRRDTKEVNGMVGTIAGVRIHRDKNVDVEETVRRGCAKSMENGHIDEADLDRRLYRWWLKGGIWGLADSSGDYKPDEDNDEVDRTSEISEDEDCDDNSSDGSAQFVRSRETSLSPDTPIDLNNLARLLLPKSLGDREEARVLSAHLTSDRVMTRSLFQRMDWLQRSDVLFAGSNNKALKDQAEMNEEDEERFLETLIISRRETVANKAGEKYGSWAEGGLGLGDGGPHQALSFMVHLMSSCM